MDRRYGSDDMLAEYEQDRADAAEEARAAAYSWEEEPSNKPRVLSEQCSTCVGRAGNLMHLNPGRLRSLVRDNLDAGALLICHQTTYGQTEEEAACRWFLDSYGPEVNVVRVMERLAALTGEPSWYVEVPPPAKEEA